ncbi:hypothetical protein [Herbidospora cretacea]|uniref:hypothetical protein n=1 Tax=Herbidospora cretacea TaxID=28444 RepID=UPI0007733815|nr:hypothetical protein [Herbidospora cretacea]
MLKARAALAALLMAGTAVVALQPTAQAATCGVGEDSAYGQIQKNSAGVGYPVTLHGTTVRLYSGRTNSRAYAKIDRDLRSDEILSIDRSNTRFTTYWPSDGAVRAGGWTYCEQRYQGLGGPTRTPTVDGYQHAVRVCLRRAGVLVCHDVWYADQNG